MCSRGIDWARDGYAVDRAQLVRVAVFGLVALAVRHGRRGLAVQDARRPASCRPRTRARSSARSSCPRAPRSTAPMRSPSRSRRSSRNTDGRRQRHLGRRLQHARRTGEIEQRPAGHDAQAVRRAQATRRCRPTALISRARRASSRRSAEANRHRLQPAADHRPRHRQRLRVPAAEPERRERRPRSRRSRAAWCSPPTRIRRCSGVFTTYSASTPQLYLDIDREKVQTLGIDVSDVFNAAAVRARQLLRQRLQPVRPDLAGERPGRGVGSQPDRRHLSASTCATATARWCRCAPSPMRASSSGRSRSSATTTSAA